ncbi:hypothetical protein GCM10028800_06290 [Nesterenkonia populi]
MTRVKYKWWRVVFFGGAGVIAALMTQQGSTAFQPFLLAPFLLFLAVFWYFAGEGDTFKGLGGGTLLAALVSLLVGTFFGSAPAIACALPLLGVQNRDALLSSVLWRHPL